MGKATVGQEAAGSPAKALSVLSAQRTLHDIGAHRALGESLRRLGHRPLEVVGIWRERRELAWQVTGMSDATAVMLGRRFGQEAVVANGTLYYLEPAGPGLLRAQELTGVTWSAPDDLGGACTMLGPGLAWAGVLGPARLVGDPSLPLLGPAPRQRS
jgi:hypothetical protein